MKEQKKESRRHRWYPTNLRPLDSLYGRYDDVFFVNPEVGWCVGSNGRAYKTTDGGNHWEQVFQLSSSSSLYLRQVGFADLDLGWIGAINLHEESAKRRRAPILFNTRDGGASWEAVRLPRGAPRGICGLCVVNRRVVVAAGTMFPESPAAVVLTEDGGATWKVLDMSAHANVLIGVHFLNEKEGWIVGGRAGRIRSKCPIYSQPSNQSDANLVPVVLHTQDGGRSWKNTVASLSFPPGEWGWKIQFLNRRIGYVSLENLCDAAILKTTDGGHSWRRIPVEKNNDLQGVGFLTEHIGWVGGWGFFEDEGHISGTSSETTDGGHGWAVANHIGRRINQFRFLGDPVSVGYSSGRQVYRLTSEPLVENTLRPHHSIIQRIRHQDGGVTFHLEVPPGTEEVFLTIWTFRGLRIRCLESKVRDSRGRVELSWDGRVRDGTRFTPGKFLCRASAGELRDVRGFDILE